MKTPIQQLIERYQEMRKNGDKVDLGTVIFLARQMLEKEKDAIMEAHFAPRYGCFSENFYNERYNTK